MTKDEFFIWLRDALAAGTVDALAVPDVIWNEYQDWLAAQPKES